MDNILKEKIDETNRLAYQFNKQNYVSMILKIYKHNPNEARAECKRWMAAYPSILGDLGMLVKQEIDQGISA